jgi:hypothetical protein
VGSRVNPAVIVERVEWGALLGHASPAVRKIAEAAGTRRASKNESEEKEARR